MKVVQHAYIVTLFTMHMSLTLEAMKGFTIVPLNSQTQRRGHATDQVMSLFLKRVYVYSLSHFMHLAWRILSWNTTI